MRMLPTSCIRVNPALMAGLALAAVSAPAADWPVYRGADRDGIAREPELQVSEEAEVAWRVEVGLGYSSPVVGDGRVIVSGHDGREQGEDTLYCFDEATGEERWTFSYPQPLGDLYFQGGTTGTATLDGARIYHLAREGELFCLEADTGEVVWQKHLQEDFDYPKPEWGFTGAPLVHGDRLYVNAGEAGVALDKKDGATIWKSDDEVAGYSTPRLVVRNGSDYLVFTNERAYVCVEAETGEEVWSLRWMTRYGVNAADPVVTDEHLFISTGYGKGCTLLRWTGEGEPETVWESREMKTQMNPAVLVDGHLYGVDGNEGQDRTGLECVEMLTGESRWIETRIGHGAMSAVERADGHYLLVLTEDGTLEIAPASPEGYEPTFSRDVLEPHVWTVPVAANGRIYCRNAAGSLVALAMGPDT